jgi:hypothetical protein
MCTTLISTLTDHAFRQKFGNGPGGWQTVVLQLRRGIFLEIKAAEQNRLDKAILYSNHTATMILQ